MLKELDWELIRDIILFKQNQTNYVYDIEIKGINSDSDTHIVVYFERFEAGQKDRVSGIMANADNVTIDWSDYLVLVRQKKLKELGI